MLPFEEEKNQPSFNPFSGLKKAKKFDHLQIFQPQNLYFWIFSKDFFINEHNAPFLSYFDTEHSIWGFLPPLFTYQDRRKNLFFVLWEYLMSIVTNLSSLSAMNAMGSSGLKYKYLKKSFLQSYLIYLSFFINSLL